MHVILNRFMQVRVLATTVDMESEKAVSSTSRPNADAYLQLRVFEQDIEVHPLGLAPLLQQIKCL
jgi:hypothetical protein